MKSHFSICFGCLFRSNLNNSLSAGLNDIEKIVGDKRFNARGPTMFYIHGWQEALSQPNVAIIPQSYAIRGGWNVIVLDWDRIAFGNYIVVWYNSIQVSDLPIIRIFFFGRLR